MKKMLLFGAALVAATCASAQIEIGFTADFIEANGIADKPTMPAGTVLASTDNVEMTLVNEGECNTQNPDFNGFKTVIVNGQEIPLVKGVGGAANPAAVNVFDGPAQGGVQYKFSVKKDGYLIVPSKISSNKNFYVYEGSFAGIMSLQAYTLGMDLQSADYPDIDKIIYSLPSMTGEDEGYADLESPEIAKYLLGGTAVAWPIRIATQNPEAASAGNGTGVLVFKVYADLDYFAFATGSKMNTCGYIFVPGKDVPEVSLYCAASEGENPRAEKTIKVCGGGTQAVEGVEAEEDANAPIYNMMGVRVNADAKGILIQNGKKFIRK